MTDQTTRPPAAAIDEQAERIGRKIRALRQLHGLTLVRLAGATGLSHPFLSQLERGLARPSMVSLERIARALGSSQVELLAAAEASTREPGDRSADLLRADEGVRGRFADGEARLLAHGSRGFEPMEFVGANRDPGDFYVHDEDEFITVISGSIVVDLGSQGSHALGPGDSLYYYGGTPHRWGSTDPAGYRLFLVKQKFDLKDDTR